MSQPFKLCPNCNLQADLAAPVCARCGRQYRTQFAPPPGPNQTQAYSRPGRRAVPMWLAGVAVVGVVVALFLWASRASEPVLVGVVDLMRQSAHFDGKRVRVRAVYHPTPSPPTITDTAQPVDATGIALSAPLQAVRPEAIAEVEGTYSGAQNAIYVTAAKEIGPPVPSSYHAAPVTGSLP